MKRFLPQKYLFLNTSTPLSEKSFLTTFELIVALKRLGGELKVVTDEDEAIFQHAYHKNNWFTRDNVELAIRNIANEFLDEEKLTTFAEQYNLFNREVNKKTVALVFAGNIPLVGFHDWLCVILSGHNALVKLSSKDDVLFPYILEKLYNIEPRLRERTRIEERLENFDAVVATGSNNSARYFEYYFGKYPHIIRKNRSSVAIIDEHTTTEELQALADDVFMYFGLGCRNVSKLFIHQGVNMDDVLKHFGKYKHVVDHNKYKNNYDYRFTILIMNKQPHHSNDYLLAVENEAVSSPLSILHYERFDNTDDLTLRLQSQSDDIQAIVGRVYNAFGSNHTPSLNDYADGVDTTQFLIDL